MRYGKRGTEPANTRYHGAAVVAASWLAVFALFGIRASFAMLKDPISLDLGWTQSQVTLGYSLMMVCYAITAFFSGTLLDRHGPRPVYLIAAVLGGVGLFTASGVSTYALYLVSFGLFAGICTGMLWVTSTVSVRTWYVGERYAGMWGMAFMGAPLAQLVLAFLMARVLVEGDPTTWRTGMALLASIVLAALVGAFALARRSPEHYGLSPAGELRTGSPESASEQTPAASARAAGSPAAAAGAAPTGQSDLPAGQSDLPAGQGWTVKQAFSIYPIWGVMAAFLANMMGEFLIWTQVVSYWSVDLGWPLSRALGVYGVIGLVGIGSMPIMGRVADRVVRTCGNEALGRKRMLLAGAGLGAVACTLLLLSAHGTAFAVAACVLFACYWAIVPGGVVGYTGAIYGRVGLGRIWGLATLIVMGIGPFTGSFLGGYFKDLSGTYTLSLAFALTTFVVACALAITLPVRPPARGS